MAEPGGVGEGGHAQWLREGAGLARGVVGDTGEDSGVTAGGREEELGNVAVVMEGREVLLPVFRRDLVIEGVLGAHLVCCRCFAGGRMGRGRKKHEGGEKAMHFGGLCGFNFVIRGITSKDSSDCY